MRFVNRKVALVGTGLVGMSYAYALLNQSVCDELALIDIDQQRAQGEAMDLNHGLAFSGSNMKIYAGGYQDCSDADIVAVCAGVAQKPGESRIDLLQRNTEVFQSIVGPVVASGFKGIFLVATNPVDVMAHVTQALSGFDDHRVLGTGTALDTARLRYLLGEYFSVDPRNVHAYVMGEHGDSEFVPWSQAMVATKPILDIFRSRGVTDYQKDLDHISEEVHLLWNRNGDGQDYPGNSRRRSQCFDGFLNASRGVRGTRRIRRNPLYRQPGRSETDGRAYLNPGGTGKAS